MVHEEWENREIEFINPKNGHGNNNRNHHIPIQQDDEEEEGYPSDGDWEDSRGQTPNQYDNSPARSNNKYPSHSPNVNGYGKSYASLSFIDSFL